MSLSYKLKLDAVCSSSTDVARQAAHKSLKKQSASPVTTIVGWQGMRHGHSRCWDIGEIGEHQVKLGEMR